MFIIFLAMFSHFSFPVCLVSLFPLMRHGFHFSWFRISTTSSIFFLLCLKKAKEVLIDREAALTPGIQNFLRPQTQLMPGGFRPSAETHIFPPCPPPPMNCGGEVEVKIEKSGFLLLILSLFLTTKGSCTRFSFIHSYTMKQEFLKKSTLHVKLWK